MLLILSWKCPMFPTNDEKYKLTQLTQGNPFSKRCLGQSDGMPEVTNKYIYVNGQSAYWHNYAFQKGSKTQPFVFFYRVPSYASLSNIFTKNKQAKDTDRCSFVYKEMATFNFFLNFNPVMEEISSSI